MAESDITAMKETLRAQQQLLQKLYAELDQEREASATAASEAMDMILRLQGEKAAVKMEASHYKRMAEEKIGHAEATLEVFDEIMYEKEMEIASLEFQIRAYRHKLLALGSDFNPSEFDFPEDLLQSMNDEHNGENGESSQSSSVRRQQSLPPIPLKNNLRAVRKRERSPSPFPVRDVTPKPVESNGQEKHREVASPHLDSPRKSPEFTYETLDSYWNQIKSIDEKVKVITDCKESRAEKSSNLRNRRGRSCTIFSQASTRINRTNSVAPFNLDKVNGHEGTKDRAASALPSCSSNVHDVFEVPQPSVKNKVSEHGKTILQKWISDADNRSRKPDSLSQEIESNAKNEVDKLKSMLSAHHDNRAPSPRDMKAIVWQKKEGTDMDCNALAEFQKLHQRIDQLERGEFSARQEVVHEGDREEHLRLLKDIYDQLKLMQSEIKSCKSQKAAPKEKISLDPLQEAMAYFWI